MRREIHGILFLSAIVAMAPACSPAGRQMASDDPVTAGAGKPSHGPAQVLIIRHGEKPAQGNDLSPAGYARAQAIVGVFESNPAFLAYGPPAAIYSMAPDPDGKDPDSGTLRPIETVTPLVQSLQARNPGLAFVDTYKKKDSKAAAEAVLNAPADAGKMVLMCWEHDAIADLLAAFGVHPPPKPWPDAIFGRVYEVDFNPDGSFRELKCRTELPADSQDCANFN